MRECSALEGGPPGFGPGFTCPALLRDRLGAAPGFAYGALTRCGRPSHAVPLPRRARRRHYRVPDGGPTTPAAQRPEACTLAGLGPGPLSLAATRGISVDFSSSGYLDVSVPRVASSRPMRSGAGARALPRAGCPIRRSPGLWPCAPHRGLSQLAASFVDFSCQGIRRAPLTSSSAGPLPGPGA